VATVAVVTNSAAPPDSVSVVSAVPSSVMATVPPGMAAELGDGLTTTSRRSDRPVAVAPSGVTVNAVALGEMSTVWEKAVDAEPAKLAVPVKVATIECVPTARFPSPSVATMPPTRCPG
jgi:hypothetical protein